MLSMGAQWLFPYQSFFIVEPGKGGLGYDPFSGRVTPPPSAGPTNKALFPLAQHLALKGKESNKGNAVG